MTTRPNPSHKWIPAYARYTDSDMSFNCLECDALIDSCNCIWAAIRDLQSRTEHTKERLNEANDAYAPHLVELQKQVDEISSYECHNRALIEDLNLSLKEYVNAVSDISMRVNKVDSLLREFEKQKIQPKFEEVATAVSDFLIRIKTIEDFIGQNYKIDIEKLTDRIGEAELRLQSYHQGNQNWVETNVKNLHNRIDDLENGAIKRIGILGNALNETSYGTYKESKSPHKCPLCEGKGYWNKVENGMACGGRCSTCEGNGIVWG